MDAKIQINTYAPSVLTEHFVSITFADEFCESFIILHTSAGGESSYEIVTPVSDELMERMGLDDQDEFLEWVIEKKLEPYLEPPF